MKRILCVCALGLILSHGYSQVPRQQGEESLESDDHKATGATLSGKLVDSKTNKGIEAGSVQVFSVSKNSLTGSWSDSLIAGMLTGKNGHFAFYNLKLPDSLRVRYTAVGYAENISELAVRNDEAEGEGLGMELGNVRLGSEAEYLNTVTVVGQRPALQLGIDRKVFNVDKNITSTGGTAIDIMRNIPSLSVDIEGNVQLRNSTPEIFVDGRPTILTLDQIAADDIEKIELITNPSAKFDAASSGGIINVVMKKNKKLGINGIASVGVGTPDVLTGNLSLNVRQGKFNFFGTGNYNQSGGLAKSETERQNKEHGTISDYFNQTSETDLSKAFRSGRFGIDYFLNNRNTISISQNFVKGTFKNNEEQQQQFLDINQVLTNKGSRFSEDKSGFTRSNSQLNYTHRFPKTGQELSADVTYNKGTRNSDALISNYYYDADGVTNEAPKFVRNRGITKNEQITVQVDYANPITEDSKFEMGLRAFRQNNGTVFNTFSLSGQQETKLPLSSNVRYNESVYAGYTTYTNKWKGIGFQVGLRAEYTEFNGVLVDSATSFGYHLPDNLGNIFDGLFPSLYLSKEIEKGTEVQLNFSRRIRRPNFWQLNPYIDINDPLNIEQGNPLLRPEYTNSFEFNYSKQYAKGSFLGVIYFRNNQDDITRYSDTVTADQYAQLNNAAVSPNAILNTFINAQYTNRMGAEFTLQHRFGNLELIPNLNLQYRKVEATVGKLNLSNQGFNWETKFIVNYKLVTRAAFLNNFNFQLTANYESREVIPQGRNKEQFVTDLALRKEFLKNNAASITFAVNDLFNGDRWGQIYDTENFYQDSYRRWNVRNFRVTFGYRFGKSDMNFNRNKREGSGGDED